MFQYIKIIIRRRPALLLPAIFIASMSFSVTANSVIEFVDLENKTVSLSDFKGNWIVVNYWATWCQNCIAEMPELGLFYEAHKDNGTVVLGVNYENIPVSQIQAFLEKQRIKFPIVREKVDIDGRKTLFGRFKGLPTTYIVSPAGKTVAIRTGRVDQKLLEAFIEQYVTKDK